MKIDIKKIDDNKYEVTSTTLEVKDTATIQVVKPAHVSGSVFIDPVSPKYLTDIALLVDRDDFLVDIQALRQKWKINNLVEFKNADVGLLMGWINRHLGDYSTDKDVKSLQMELDEDVASLRTKYGRTSNYDQVVLWVLFTNMVPDRAFKACYFTTIPDPTSDDPNRCKYAIILDGRTEIGELKQAFEEFKKHLRNLESVQSLRDLPTTDSFESLIAQIVVDNNKGPVGRTTNRYAVRTQTNIMLIRELYWKRKFENTSFAELARIANDRCVGDHSEDSPCMFCNADETNVRKSLQNYEKTVNRKL